MLKRDKSESVKLKKEHIIVVLITLLLVSGVLYFVFFITKSEKEVSLLENLCLPLYEGDIINFSLKVICFISLFLVCDLFLAVSPFGFLVIPFLGFFLGVVTALSFCNAYLLIKYKVLFLYLPFWSILNSYLVIYFSKSLKASFAFYIELSGGFKEAESIKNNFKLCIKYFYKSLVLAVLYTAFFGLAEIFLGSLNF